MGSPWGKDEGIDDAAFPMQMRVDWVRVYALSSSTARTQVWALRARGEQGQSGCSDEPAWAGSGYNLVSTCTDHCAKVYTSVFVEFHPSSNWCGCFDTCDFTRPSSSYDSPADVYESIQSSV